MTGTDLPGVLGTAVPGFELGELIGRGGCASVYRARQVSVARDVALKIDNRHVTSERDRRRFVREVTSIGRLSGHPHVVEVYDAGVLPDDRPWIAMQLCPRGSLHEHVREHGPLAFAELQRVGVQLADALATAHDAGIVHRDVKPGNVLVNTYGVVMLSDFGLASVVDADSRQTATRGVYTPAYAAPEALGLDEPRPALDLWSFACTIFELATARLPRFRGGGEPIGPDDVVAAALSEPFEPVALPPDLVAWIVRGLAFDPAGRWASAAQMRDELAALDLTVVPEPPALRPRIVPARLTDAGPAPGASPVPSLATQPAASSPRWTPAPSSPGQPDEPAEPAEPAERPARRRPGPRLPAGGGAGRSWGLAALAALALAVVVLGTWAVSARLGQRAPAAATTATTAPVGAGAVLPGSPSPSSSAKVPAPSVPAEDPGLWLLDGDELQRALGRVRELAGHDLRLTNVMGVRVSGSSQLMVQIQDPQDRGGVLQYTVDGAGVVTGPEQVTSQPLLDVGATRVTAAMVDRKTFAPSALPDKATFGKGQRAAITRVRVQKAEIVWWTFNAHLGGPPRLMLGLESPYSNAIVVELGRRGEVVQVMT